MSIGLTSYDGGVFFGITADRDAVPDLDELARLITTALADLRAAGRPTDIDTGGRRRRRRAGPRT